MTLPIDLIEDVIFLDACLLIPVIGTMLYTFLISPSPNTRLTGQSLLHRDQ